MLFKFALSFTSFMPLYSLMVIMYAHVYTDSKTTDNAKKYIVIAIVLIVLTQIIFTFLVSKYINDKVSSNISESHVIFSNISEEKKASINYMFTYVLPFISFNSEEVDLFYLIYTNILIILFILMNAKAENFNFNYLLTIKGYSVYQGINEYGEEKTLLLLRKGYSNIRNRHHEYGFISFGGSSDIYICRDYPE